ncbi:MAG: hypothetical protein IJJ06_12255 [Mogibacterium sp.]|nr:hypothetical protein [Mogibacterium sp.]MBR0341760.1 hypothetical protein [Oscillospiraceae bacterium]
MKKRFRFMTSLLVITLVLTMMQSIAFGYNSPYPGVSIDVPGFPNELGLGESFTFTPIVIDSDTEKDLTANIVYEAQDIKGVTLTDSNGKRIQNGDCAYEPRDKSFKAPITVTRTSRGECWFDLCAYDTTEEYTGLISLKSFELKMLPKAKNTITVKAKKVTVKYSKLRKSSQKIAAKKAFTVSKAEGKVSYKKIGGNKKITVAKNGTITLKKGLKKGTYSLKVKIKASGNDAYKSSSKNITVKIKIK